MKKYYYAIFDCGDGSAGILYFETRELADLYFELNEESDCMDYILDEGFIEIEGTLASKHLTTEAEIHERFAEWGEEGDDETDI